MKNTVRKVVQNYVFRLQFSFVLTLSTLFGITNQSFAQLNPSTYNYGKVQLWNNPKAIFRYTNNTNKRSLFLPIQYQRDLYLHLPEGYIEPGQSVTIEAIYYTEERGSFSISQPIYLSGLNEPIILTLQGKILSFHPDAHTACPTIEHKTNPIQKPATASITVYDKSTGLAINGVDVLLVGSSTNYFIEHTRKLKLPLNSIPIGLYQLDISKAGYNPIQQIQYISTNTGDLVFELEPIKGEVATISVDQTTSGEDRIVQIDKVEDSDQDAIERLRKMMDERFKGRKIIERDVMVVKENADSTPQTPKKIESPTPKIDLSTIQDFDESGKLNSLKYVPNNVVFLIDVSGSMKIDDKLESLKVSMKSVVDILRPQDKVTIIIYSTKARIVLESTPGDQKETINAVIDGLRANGSSYGADGLSLAYQFAKGNFIPKGNNQIILASDGLFNTKDVTESDLFAMADANARIGITTSVVGFGRKEAAKIFMKSLAENGAGNFIQIVNFQEAQSALVAEIMHNAIVK